MVAVIGFFTLELIYPLCKRFTDWPQAVLGMFHVANDTPISRTEHRASRLGLILGRSHRMDDECRGHGLEADIGYVSRYHLVWARNTCPTHVACITLIES